MSKKTLRLKEKPVVSSDGNEGDAEDIFIDDEIQMKAPPLTLKQKQM